eukprot:COSAG03_NODE_5770_length_1177_cov_4.545455_1_plen_118_part_00
MRGRVSESVRVSDSLCTWYVSDCVCACIRVWQLERFLSLHSHPKIDRDLEATLEAAEAALVAPQVRLPKLTVCFSQSSYIVMAYRVVSRWSLPQREALQEYRPMKVYDWLVRTHCII